MSNLNQEKSIRHCLTPRIVKAKRAIIIILTKAASLCELTAPPLTRPQKVQAPPGIRTISKDFFTARATCWSLSQVVHGHHNGAEEGH